MAFPTIPTVVDGRALTAAQADTSATRTFPDLSSLTKSAGDLLMALIVVYQTSVASPVITAWGGGFTEFMNNNGSTTNVSLAGAFKASDGTETGTFTATQRATITGHAAMILLSIPGADTATPPEESAQAVGTTAAADPGLLTPSWGSADTLWIAVGGIGETSLTGSFTGLTTSPTTYSGDILTSISADAIGGVQLGVGFRQVTAGSGDIPGWTLDTSNARNSAVLIAVKPAAAPAGGDDVAQYIGGGYYPMLRDRAKGIFLPERWRDKIVVPKRRELVLS